METVLAILNVLAQLMIGAGVVYGIYQNIMVAKNVLKIEVATNSMKDALVASTAKASNLEGNLEGRAEQRAEIHAEKEAKL